MERWFAALLLAAGCTHPANIDPPAPSSLAERFELVAFYDEISGDEIPLHRWNSDVRVFVSDRNSAPYREDALALLERLDRLTPMRVGFAGGSDDANIVVLIGTWLAIDIFRVMSPDRVTTARPRRFTCAAIMFPTEQSTPNVLAKGWVLIDADLDPDHIRRCLAQEIAQALGLPNDIDDPDGTVFSTYSRRETLSTSDENIVRILYDPRLRPGMSRAEAMPIVREIAAELEAE